MQGIKNASHSEYRVTGVLRVEKSVNMWIIK
nr:MAG TPA: hypothetical protein [Caudoviricetes sp.]